ncbi:uncharacterized protein [Clytia hemisphaerica]|uniref:Uncharacterized protein n=1 Tax=Clytia hemisphaerica TaxID=252671 RepID=A0A7M5WK41_9CNID
MKLKLAREISFSILYLNTRSSKVFYLSIWRHIHPYLLLGLRVFISIYSIVFMGLSIYSYEASRMWLLHITTWNYILSTLYFVLVIGIGLKELFSERRQSISSYSVISISPREHEDGELTEPAQRTGNAIPIILLDGKEIIFNYDSDASDSDDDDVIDIDDDVISVGYQLPIFYKMTYCIFNVSGNLSVVIAIAYWSMLHNYDIPILLNLTSYIQIDGSVIILFWFLLEVIFNDIPIHILHFVYPLVTVIVYFVTYIVYTVSTGHVVYDNINFIDHPGHAGFVVLIFAFAVLLIQLVLFLLEQLKRYLADRLNKLRKESRAYAEDS